MFYPNELASFKKTNFKHPKGLLIFNEALPQAPVPQTTPENDKHVEKKIIQRIFKFCLNSIHGLNHIWQPGVRPAVRIFWCLLVTTAIIGCLILYIVVSQRHREQILVTVVETSHLPIHSIHFPAVAVCPFNHINWMRYQAAEERFLPRKNANSDARKVFYNLTVLLESMTFTGLGPIKDFLNAKRIPRSVQNLVISDVAQFLAFRCDEIFRWCIYDKTEQDCCKIFVSENTERGICLVFNSDISKESRIKKLTDSFYPWRSRSGGEGSGLSFSLKYNHSLIRSGTNVPFAFSVLIKEPGEWSNSLFHILHKNTHNNLMVTPIITETSRYTRHISPAKRQCIFPNEKSTKYDRIEGLQFNKLNCQVQCEKRYLMNTCNCTMSMFFPRQLHYSERECRVSDLRCIYENKDIFNYLKGPLQDEYINDTRRGMTCDCVNSCESLLFLVQLNVLPHPNANESFPEISAEVYFAKNTLTKYVTRVQYNFLGLLSNFGGIMGLCLGASVLSILEMFYGIIRAIFIYCLYKLTYNRKVRKINVDRDTQYLGNNK
ncbi:pickpocket protein 19-like [Musca autumnalis]|uniref:pickpocket protein 19-like n=1 Tax=Musca autumnalis TaxID=221902 RepID=UPI003CF90FFD